MSRPRRPLTDEQIAARDARRERFGELAKRLAELSDEARADLAARVFVHTVEGRPLSLHNACLVAMQNPTATLVGGFNQWRTQGRTVRKGEHGLMIWAPTKATIEAAPTAGELTTESDARRFITVTVFDVSQTDALSA